MCIYTPQEGGSNKLKDFKAHQVDASIPEKDKAEVNVVTKEIDSDDDEEEEVVVAVVEKEEKKEEEEKEKEEEIKEGEKEEQKPFQKLQFLVRDWQNFEVDSEELDQVSPSSSKDESSNKGQSVYEALRVEMREYLAEVLRSRGLSDLQSTREQITRCFSNVDCFMLPHPGFAVTKKNFDGSISKMKSSVVAGSSRMLTASFRTAHLLFVVSNV